MLNLRNIFVYFSFLCLYFSERQGFNVVVLFTKTNKLEADSKLLCIFAYLPATCSTLYNANQRDVPRTSQQQYSVTPYSSSLPSAL
jgi:hypothetical protein